MASIISSMVARSGSVMEDWQKSSLCLLRFVNRVITLDIMKQETFSAEWVLALLVALATGCTGKGNFGETP